MQIKTKLAIIGSGIMGKTIAQALIKKKWLQNTECILTSRSKKTQDKINAEKLHCITDNVTAIKNAKIIILAVRPHDANTVLKEIGSHLKKGQIFVSIVTGLEINDLQKQIKKGVPIIRAMPNTALKVYQSMTCLVPSKDVVNEDMNEVQALFNHLGTTAIIREDQMSSATALCACGVAFFMRAIRAASQGGVEVGFHADFAINLVAQTALGASALVLNGEHPEYEVDQVTTPEGCTIAGLNEMEHSGLSSAFIKGIVTSAKKAKTLYSNNSSAKK